VIAFFSEPSNPRRPNLRVTDSSWGRRAMKHFKFDVSVSAKKQRVNLFGTDQRTTSGQLVKSAALKGRI